MRRCGFCEICVREGLTIRRRKSPQFGVACASSYAIRSRSLATSATSHVAGLARVRGVCIILRDPIPKSGDIGYQEVPTVHHPTQSSPKVWRHRLHHPCVFASSISHCGFHGAISPTEICVVEHFVFCLSNQRPLAMSESVLLPINATSGDRSVTTSAGGAALSDGRRLGKAGGAAAELKSAYRPRLRQDVAHSLRRSQSRRTACSLSRVLASASRRARKRSLQR